MKREIAGTCTWALRLPDRRYVLDPDGQSVTTSIDEAYLWLDEQRALTWASETPWAAAALTTRARP